MSRLQAYLNEEYIGRFKQYKTYGKISCEVFKNPSIRELKGYKNFRFIADNRKKDLYVFDYRLLHAVASEILGLKGYKGKNFFCGVAVLKNGKYEGFSSDTIDLTLTIDEFMTKWGWVEKLISIKPFIELRLGYKE